MKRYSQFFFVLALFGSLHIYWAVSNFGFEAVDLPPFSFFLFSLWSCVRNAVTYTLLLSAPIFLFGRFARWVITVVWAYIVVVVCACYYVSRTFHATLSSIWIELLLNTSADEVFGFLRMSFGLWQILGLALICLVIAMPFVVLRSLPSLNCSRRSVLIGMVLMLPFLLFNVSLVNWHWGVSQMPYTSFLVSSVMSYERGRGFRCACENKGIPKVVNAVVSSNDMPNVVIVIGESATRNNWHLYGYERHTTPRMDEICRSKEGVALEDVVGIAPDTVYALGFLMTDVTFESLKKGNWTIGEVLRRAGYRTVTISNQQVWGGSDALLSAVFNGFSRQISMLEKKKGKTRHDEVVVSYLRDELSRPGPQAVAIHLAGMHYPVHNACPEDERHFTDQIENGVLAGLSEYNRDRRNRYDNGILYEDKVLGLIVDALKEQDRPSVMFFISDHGESPRSDGWRVFTDRDVYELPCVVWMSQQYRQRFPKTASALFSVSRLPLQPDLLTGGLLELAQIDLSNLNVVSFLCPDFRCRFPRKINKGRLNYETKSEH